VEEIITKSEDYDEENSHNILDGICASLQNIGDKFDILRTTASIESKILESVVKLTIFDIPVLEVIQVALKVIQAKKAVTIPFLTFTLDLRDFGVGVKYLCFKKTPQ